ncbi:MAG: NUDIX domain-containing protein [Patescibacteria group bacterium]|jgi:isopentenyl-diphosphate delta-isomerase
MNTLKAIIVNEKDEIIGSKKREDITSSDIYRVSALWLTNSKGEVLMAQRALTKKHDPGIWGPAVAGTVEEGETYDSNIAKETEEELGLTGVTMTKGAKNLRTGNHTYFCQWYFGHINKKISDLRLRPEEVIAARWVSPALLLAEAREHPERFTPNTRKHIERFCS